MDIVVDWVIEEGPAVMGANYGLRMGILAPELGFSFRGTILVAQ